MLEAYFYYYYTSIREIMEKVNRIRIRKIGHIMSFFIANMNSV